MKPVLIQHLIKHNKKRSVNVAVTEKEQQHANDRAASFVLWALGVIILASILAA